MTKMKIQDAATGRVGAIMHNARMACHISRDELADLLDILPNDLAAYEHGKTTIPADLLERIFAMGYNMMRMRVLENKYRKQCKIFRKLKEVTAAIQ